MQIKSKLKPENIKNILVIRNDRFGEFLLNIPAFRALKESFVNARITAVTDPYVKELAESVPFIDEVIPWARKKHQLAEKIQLARALKNKKFDIAIMLNPSQEFNKLAWICGIPIRAGYDRKWGFLLTHKIKDEKYLGNKHEIEYNLELTGIIGARTDSAWLCLKVDTADKDNLFKRLNLSNRNNLIAMHPWTSDSIKQWPYNNFRGLAKELAGGLNVTVIVIGSGIDPEKSEQLFNDLGNNVINLTGKTTLKELAAVISDCKLLISGDSGPVHLASCLGVPVVAIFRNDLPQKCSRRWGPKSSGSIVIEKPDLSDINVDEVLQKTKEILHRRESGAMSKI